MVTMSQSAPPASQPIDLLDHEQSQVSAALQATLRDMWGQVPSSAQLKTWAEANPLMAAGLAAGAGAVAGAVVTPRSRPSMPMTSSKSAPPESRSSLLGTLFSQALPMVSMVISEASRNLLMTSLAGQEGVGQPRAEQVEQFDAGEGI